MINVNNIYKFVILTIDRIMGNQQLPCSQKFFQACQLPLADGPVAFQEKSPSPAQRLDNKQQISKSSIKKINAIDLQEIYIVPQASSLMRRILSQVMDVPFDVVFLCITEKLKSVINSLGSNHIQKYQKKHIQSKWKLHKKAAHTYAIFTPHLYFQGQLIQQQDNFLPVNEGILISQEGVYTGHFSNGKAHGKGYFKGMNNNTIYQGKWKEGEMTQGTIENQQFEFEGFLQDRLPHGKGKIHFKKSKHSYKGMFENGFYHDQNGLQQCVKYIYTGQFKNGLKQGNGYLKQKQMYAHPKIKSFRPSRQFKGNWRRDYFYGKGNYVDTLEMIQNIQ